MHEHLGWQSHYIPPDPLSWQGRVEIPADSCLFQHIETVNLLTDSPEKRTTQAFALVGFKCDEGVQRDLGRGGAAEGPIAIRQQLINLPIQNTNLQLFDVGNIVCLSHDLEAAQAALADIVAKLLTLHICPIIMGGGHELAWGHYQGIHQALNGSSRLGIINFDPHFDLHAMHPSHRASASTAFYQIAYAHQQFKKTLDYNCIGIQPSANIRADYEIAKKFNTKFLLADELHQGVPEKSVDFIDRVVDVNDHVYVSLSLEVFAPAYAPGVNCIQPLGLAPWNIIPLIRQLAASGKVISYDIAEMIPRYDIDHRTAKLAAALIYEIIHHHHDTIKN